MLIISCPWQRKISPPWSHWTIIKEMRLLSASTKFPGISNYCSDILLLISGKLPKNGRLIKLQAKRHLMDGHCLGWSSNWNRYHCISASQTFLSVTSPCHCSLHVTHVVSFHWDTASEKMFPRRLVGRNSSAESEYVCCVVVLRGRKVARFILVMSKLSVHNRNCISQWIEHIFSISWQCSFF